MNEREKSVGEWIYPRLGRRIPQESSRITGGEPWSLGNHPWVVGDDLEKKPRGETEGVPEPPLIPQSLTRRIYLARTGYVRRFLTYQNSPVKLISVGYIRAGMDISNDFRN
jgi:hypothetical protein